MGFRNPKYKHKRVGVFFPRAGENGYDGMTEQHHKDACDIHFILKRCDSTGVLSHTRRYPAEYGVIPEIDYHTAMIKIAQADQLFSALPSELRKRFHNDPGTYLDFVLDAANRDEMESMGISTTHFPPVEQMKAPEAAPVIPALPEAPDKPA